MFIKVIGIQGGLYREKVYDHVDDYTFTNNGEELEKIVYSGDNNIPYSHLVIEYEDPDKIHTRLSFNTRAYIMEAQNGKTIDILKYDPRKDFS